MQQSDDWSVRAGVTEGFHPPEQCARGRDDCRSLAQVVSTGGPQNGFVCCGEVKPGCTPEPRDKWALCVRGEKRSYCDATDIRIFIDEPDTAHLAYVTSAGMVEITRARHWALEHGERELAGARPPRTDANEIANPRCGCPAETVRRVVVDHGTCGRGRPLMTTAFIAHGKQVKHRGRHFADAADQAAADLIARTLNRALERAHQTPARQPLTALRAAEPKPDEGVDHEQASHR